MATVDVLIEPVSKDTVKQIENEINDLRRQLHKIEEQIREKSIQLSTAMAESVSLKDIDEILNLEIDRQQSDVSLSIEPTEHKESIETSDSALSETTPKSQTLSKLDKKSSKKLLKKKKKKKEMNKKRKAKNLWKELENQIIDGNIEYVKKLIQLNKIQINDNTQWNGRTILMMAAERGQYDICCMLINSGADVRLTTKYDDTRDAQYFAHKMHHYHIERLLLISSFGGESSAKIKDTINTLKKQQAIATDFITAVENNDESKSEWIENMTDYLCVVIQKKMAFSDDLLSLCWKYMQYKYKQRVLECNLWKVMIKSCEEVIQGKDSNQWFWFKQYMARSTIWLQSDPSVALDDLLVNHLFRLSNTQSEINSTSLQKMEQTYSADWDSLIAFDIKTNYGWKPRQDEIRNGLIAKYSKEELSQNINPSTTFNALKHYDINQYLPNLLLVCHIIDDEFQCGVMHAFDINAATNRSMDKDNYVKYRRGPVKQLTRCKAKAENDYIQEKYPSSAHLLDVVRCSLIFDDVKGLLEELNIFVQKVNDNQCGAIKEIVRIKNGFKEWNSKTPNYCDIKLNVRIETKSHFAVIGEIQLLLKDMSVFKLTSHKLYNITRLDEEYLSLLKIKPIMMNHEKCLLNASYFNDAKEISNLMVVHQKDIDFIANHISLKIICDTNGYKILKTLKQYMNIEQLTLKLKKCGGFQAICNKGYFDLIRYIYSDILPKSTQPHADILKNGLSEAINAGHTEIVQWMFSEEAFLKSWNEFDMKDKQTFFRTVCELGATDCAMLLVQHFGDKAADESNENANIYAIECMCGEIMAKKKDNVQGNEDADWNAICKVCDNRILIGVQFWHCSSNESKQHSDGYDLCVSCGEARRQTQSMNTPLCGCGSKLVGVMTYNAYGPTTGVSCNVCGRSVDGAMFHCPQNYNETHKHGFDLCVSCGQTYEAKKKV